MAQNTQDLVARAKQQVEEISAEEAQKRLDHGAVALDVRDDHEVEAGHLPGAVHITRGCLEFQVGNNPATREHDRELVVYCKGGGRSALAAQTLETMGYTNVASMRGGYDGWVEAGRPVQVSTAGTDDEDE